jgi:hypothetical protein
MFLVITSQPIIARTFIHGYVYDATDSTAIDSATVHGVCIDTEGEFWVATNQFGYYHVEEDSLLPKGSWSVTADAVGYAPQTRFEFLPEREHINFYLWPQNQ